MEQINYKIIKKTALSITCDLSNYGISIELVITIEIQSNLKITLYIVKPPYGSHAIILPVQIRKKQHAFYCAWVAS